MPTFRRDLESIPTYDPGRPITEVSASSALTTSSSSRQASRQSSRSPKCRPRSLLLHLV